MHPVSPSRLEDLALVEVGAAMMCINLLWGMGACTPLAPAAWRTWRWWSWSGVVVAVCSGRATLVEVRRCVPVHMTYAVIVLCATCATLGPQVGVRCSLEQMLEEGFYHADPQ